MGVKAPADKRFKRGRVKTPRKAARRWTAWLRPVVKWTLVLGILGSLVTAWFSRQREFRGAERRFQPLGEAGGVLVVDDYGHHPTEIAAVIAAARAGLDRRVVVVFQPHRYTRTRDLLDQFGSALGNADEIILTDIYPAGESPIPGATAEAVQAVVRKTGRPVTLVKSLDDIPSAVARAARPGDLVITLGAGSIGSMPDRILEALQTSSAGKASAKLSDAARAEGEGEAG